MQKKLILALLAGGVMTSAALIGAQPTPPLDLSIVFRGDIIDPVNGGANPGPSEFDTIAVTPDGATVYLFDSIGTFDSIFSVTGGVPTAVTTEALLAAGAGSAGDLAADATNLYTSVFDGAKQRIWRIPHVGGFGSAVEMIDTTGGASINMDEIEVDATNSRLVITYNDAFGLAAEDIVTVPLNATAATPTLLITEANLEAVLATITGYVDDTGDDINSADITVQNDGDIIYSHGFTPNRQVGGSLLRITSLGAASVFRTGDQIITSAGGDPNTIDIGQVYVEALSLDEILILVAASSNTGTFPPFLAVISADGTTQTALATQAQLTGDADIVSAGTTLIPGGQFLIAVDGKSAGQVVANDDFFFFRQSNPSTSAPAEQNAVFRLSGIRSFLTPSVGNWYAY